MRDFYTVKNRYEFLVLYQAGPYTQEEAIFISDFMDDLYIENLPLDDEDFIKIYNLWNDITKCVQQANEMCKMAKSPEQAERIYNIHIDGLVPLYKQMKCLLISTRFIEFADKRERIGK